MTRFELITALALGLTIGLVVYSAINRASIIPDSEAQTCCAYKQKGPDECLPCRPRREVAP